MHSERGIGVSPVGDSVGWVTWEKPRWFPFSWFWFRKGLLGERKKNHSVATNRRHGHCSETCGDWGSRKQTLTRNSARSTWHLLCIPAPPKNLRRQIFLSSLYRLKNNLDFSWILMKCCFHPKVGMAVQRNLPVDTQPRTLWFATSIHSPLKETGVKTRRRRAVHCFYWTNTQRWQRSTLAEFSAGTGLCFRICDICSKSFQV